MLELGISQAQTQFTKLLTQTVVIVDKKSHIKKAVIMPYEDYTELVSKNMSKNELENGIFNKFAGILDNEFKVDDNKYKRIMS